PNRRPQRASLCTVRGSPEGHSLPTIGSYRESGIVARFSCTTIFLSVSITTFSQERKRRRRGSHPFSAHAPPRHLMSYHVFRHGSTCILNHWTTRGQSCSGIQTCFEETWTNIA